MQKTGAGVLKITTFYKLFSYFLFKLIVLFGLVLFTFSLLRISKLGII
ncbi:hypothetical protein FEM08_29040 [Flavobacterium gilvum]|nr:hypothetical protein FEM08_29040 [Flavobacterium gilvum]